MNRWIGAKDDFRRVRCSTQDFCSHVSRCVRFRVQGRPLFPMFTATKPLSTLEWMVTMLWVQLQAEGRMQSNTDKLCDSLHLSSEYLAKLQPNISRRGTHWLLGHRSEEIYALHSQQWRHIQLMKIGTNTTLYFNCIVRQDLCWATPPRPSACTTTRQLSKPEFHLWITITIRVEMTPLMTESRSDYQHTRNFDSFQLNNHHNLTTNPWLCPPTTSKKLWLSISQDGYVLQYRHACENYSRIRKMSPSSKMATSVL